MHVDPALVGIVDEQGDYVGVMAGLPEVSQAEFRRRIQLLCPQLLFASED